MLSLAPLGNRVIVDPYYDAERVYGLIIPDSAKNPMSQQGKVVAVGDKQKDIVVGDHVLYHPYVGTPFRADGHEYLSVEYREIAGYLAPDGEVFPLPDDVMLIPEFAPSGVIKSGLLWLPRQVFDTEVPHIGRVVRVGERVTCVSVGQRVAFDFQYAGSEIGIDTGKSRGVYYTMNADKYLLATLED